VVVLVYREVLSSFAGGLQTELTGAGFSWKPLLCAELQPPMCSSPTRPDALWLDDGRFAPQLSIHFASPTNRSVATGLAQAAAIGRAVRRP